MTNPTHYISVDSLDTAVKELAEPDSMPLVGGAYLLRGFEPVFSRVVDVSGIKELAFIRYEAGRIHIGANQTLQSLIESDLFPDWFKKSISRTETINIRNAVTVAEALVSEQASQDFLTTLVALDARLIAMDPKRGEKDWQTLSVRDVLSKRDEAGFSYRGLIRELILPDLDQYRFASAMVSRTPVDDAIVYVAALFRTETDKQSLHIALAGIDEKIVSLDVDYEEASFDLESILKQIQAMVQHPGNYLGSKEYRFEMARVIGQRAILGCLQGK